MPISSWYSGIRDIQSKAIRAEITWFVCSAHCLICGSWVVTRKKQPRLSNSSKTAAARPEPSAGSVPLPSSSNSTRLSRLHLRRMRITLVI